VAFHFVETVEEGLGHPWPRVLYVRPILFRSPALVQELAALGPSAKQGRSFPRIAIASASVAAAIAAAERRHQNLAEFPTQNGVAK